MKKIETEKQLLLVIRGLVAFFILAIVASGITAFPLESELKILCNILGISTDLPPNYYSGFENWISTVYWGVRNTNLNYPFIMYGCDWLAFAHIMIGVSFLGVYFKPVRNIWIVYFAMIACVSVIPTVIICGAVRDIPIYWQLVDCSFGIFGMIPLLILRHYIKRLAKVSGYVEQKY